MKNTLALALIAGLTACTPPSSPAPQPEPMPVDVAPFIARAREHADAEMQALAGGQLTITDGCVRLTSPVGNPGYFVVWPMETTIDASTGAVRIRNPANGSDVGIGDIIEMSGGEAPALAPDVLAEAPPAQCTGPYWIAGAHWAVTSAN